MHGKPKGGSRGRHMGKRIDVAVRLALPISIVLATAVFGTMFRYEVRNSGRDVFVLDRWSGALDLCQKAGAQHSRCLPYLSAGMDPVAKPATVLTKTRLTPNFPDELLELVDKDNGKGSD